MFRCIIKYSAIVSLLIVLLTQTAANTLFAQTSVVENDSLILQTDQSRLKVEPVPQKKIDDFRHSNAFKYDEVQVPGIDFWSIFWYYVNKILRAIFSNEGAAPYIRYLVMLLVLGFVIYKIIGGGFSGLFSRNNKVKGKNGFEYAEEDIYQQDLDEKLSNAIKNKNYREAIRYYYIKLLKELDINKLIQWEAGKTNRDYQKELKNSPIFSSFVSLSAVYEYAWYGQFDVEEGKFEIWQANFINTFKNVVGK